MIKVTDIKDNEVIGGIVILNVVRVIDAICPDVAYNERIQLVSAWAQANNLDEYAAPREFFNEYEAAAHARQDGYFGVIVEDLS